MPPLTPDQINTAVRSQFPGHTYVCTELGPDFAVGSYEVQSTNLRPGGFVSGPTQFGIADAVLWYATFAVLGRIEPMAMTSELSIRYVRPAIGTVLRARADIEAFGRRNVVGTVRIWMDDDVARPTAVAQGTYVRPHPAADPTD